MYLLAYDNKRYMEISMHLLVHDMERYMKLSIHVPSNLM